MSRSGGPDPVPTGEGDDASPAFKPNSQRSSKPVPADSPDSALAGADLEIAELIAGALSPNGTPVTNGDATKTVEFVAAKFIHHGLSQKRLVSILEEAIKRAKLPATYHVVPHPNDGGTRSITDVRLNLPREVKNLVGKKGRGERLDYTKQKLDELAPGLRERIEAALSASGRTGNSKPRAGKVISEVSAGDRGTVTHYDDRVEWTTERFDADGGLVQKSWTVIDGHLDVLGRYEIDGDELYRVREDKESFVSATLLRHRLDASAKIVDHSKAPDALSLVLRDETRGRVTKGHSAAGIYSDEERRLVLDTTPFPRYAEQIASAEAIRKVVNAVGTSGDVQAYVDLLGLWDQYEILPVMGFAAASLFALAIRQAREIFPHLVHVSTEHGLGKTSTATAFTERLFGIPVVSADSIRSSFRIAAAFDAIGCARSIDEAEKVDDRVWGPELKALAEQGIGAKRGTPTQEMLTYLSRASVVLTGNRLAFSSPATLVRLIVVRYNASKLGERRTQIARKKLKDIERRLRPIGWDLARHAVTMYPTVEALTAELTRLEGKIDAAYDGAFEDGRRPTVWSCVYLGLQIWESYGLKLGVRWSAPKVEEFVRTVVLRVEASTFGAAAQPIEKFASWLDGYLSRERLANGTVRGENETWRYDVVARTLGRWITAPILAEYNKQAPEIEKVESIAALARGAAKAYDLPESDVCGPVGMDGERAARVVRFPISGTTRHSAFIPLAESSVKEGGYTLREGNKETPTESSSENSVSSLPSQRNTESSTMEGGSVSVFPFPGVGAPHETKELTEPPVARIETLFDLIEKGATDGHLIAVLRLRGASEESARREVAGLRQRTRAATEGPPTREEIKTARGAIEPDVGSFPAGETVSVETMASPTLQRDEAVRAALDQLVAIGLLERLEDGGYRRTAKRAPGREEEA